MPGTITPTRRDTASLNIRNKGALRTLIRASWLTPFGPTPQPQSFEWTNGDELRAGPAEFADGPRFFRHFFGELRPADLHDQDILDVGCGHGGRTVYYAEVCGARSVHGIEPSERVIDRCRRFAEERASTKTSFSVGRAEELPFPDQSFDCVISFDVLEHCEDPRLAAREMSRVLRPAGRAWNVFPTYKGARSSHLEWITMLPFLHRAFHPDTIVEVVNEFIADDGSNRLGVQPQPQPSWSALGHYTLPRLNGLTLKEALEIFNGTDRLRCDKVIVTPLVDSQLSRQDAEAVFQGSKALALLARGTAETLAAWQRRLPLPECLVQNVAVCSTRI